ncbi:MAG: S-layer homology domain-containing protein [Bacillota bacterium]|nr:S-layer homology domain-containing protein [Bacillota bacterium]
MAVMLSVMVVGAGAAFSDQSKIKNTEAVDMCSALNIINGYEDGSFKPEGNITRAEACKMICIALNGGKEPVLGTNATPSFTDIKGHWAEGYIEYCYSEGIVAGVGGGKFDPAGNVTGSQFAKMLLIALGYRADHEKFTGAAWEVNVNVKATQKDLYDELETMDPSVALTRDNAAQMVWNALNANEVAYEYTLATENGQLVSKVTVKDVTNPKNLMTDKYGANTDEPGVLTKVTKDENKDTYNLYIGFGEKPSYTKVAADYSDLIGQNVKVVNKASDKVLGVFADEDCAVIAEGVVGQLKLDSRATDKSIKLDGTAYDLDQAANATVCYLTNGIAAQGKLSDQMINDQAAWGVKLIDNDGDGDVNVAVLTKVTVAKITYANATGIRVDATAYDFDDHTIYDGAAKDDWAVIVDKAYTADGKAIITKADTVSGKVSSVKTDSQGNTTEVRIDGTWYKAAIPDDTTKIKDKVDLVVYEGLYFYAPTMTTSLDIAVVTGVGNYDMMNKTASYKLMFADGKEEVVPVEKWDSYTGSDLSNGAWTNYMVSYEIDDGNYTLTTVPNGEKIDTTDYTGVKVAAAANDGYTKNISAVEIGDKDYDIADNAMVVFYDGDDYTYMTGADLLKKNNIAFTANKTIFAAVDGNEIAALFAQTGTSISSGDEQYGYIVAVGEELNKDGDTKLYIDVIVNGEKKTNVETDKDSVGSFAKGDVITYTMDGDVMNITKVTESFPNKAAIKEFNSTRVIFYNATYNQPDYRVTLADDVVVIAIDSDDADNVLYAGKDLMEANAIFNDSGDQTGWQKNAMYHLDDNEIDVIFVEIDADSHF